MPFTSARDASHWCARMCVCVSQKSKFFFTSLLTCIPVSFLSPLIRRSNRLVSLRKEFLFNFYRSYCCMEEKRNQFVRWCHLYVALALLKSMIAYMVPACNIFVYLADHCRLIAFGGDEVSYMCIDVIVQL